VIKILFLGEIIGIPTIKILEDKIGSIKQKYNIDFIIANCDGTSDGYGLLKRSASKLHGIGINAITSGDFIFNKKDVKELLKLPYVLKPYNLPTALGGKGYFIFNYNNIKIAVINILGRTNFNKIFAMDPFYSVDKVIEKINYEAKIVIVDFHGGTTSEIQAMHWYLAGRASLVAGSHLRVLTADNRVVAGKTGIITGLGYCGGYYSVGGLSVDVEIKKVKDGQFYYSKIEKQDIVIQGVISDIDENTGKAVSINLINEIIT